MKPAASDRWSTGQDREFDPRFLVWRVPGAFAAALLVCGVASTSSGAGSAEEFGPGRTVVVCVMGQTGHAYYDGDIFVDIYEGDDRVFVDSESMPPRTNILTNLPLVGPVDLGAGAPPLGGEEFRFAVRQSGVYWIKLDTGRFVTITDGNVLPSDDLPVRGQTRTDERGNYIVGTVTPVFEDPDYEGTGTPKHFKVEKTYYVLRPQWVPTYVAEDELIDRVLIVVDDVSAKEFKDVVLEQTTDFILDKGLVFAADKSGLLEHVTTALSGIASERMVKDGVGVTATVIVRAATDADRLLSGGTLAAVAKNLLKRQLVRVLFKNAPASPYAAVALTVAEVVIVQALEQAEIKSRSDTDDIVVSSTGSFDPMYRRGAGVLTLRNLGADVYDAAVCVSVRSSVEPDPSPFQVSISREATVGRNETVVMEWSFEGLGGEYRDFASKDPIVLSYQTAPTGVAGRKYRQYRQVKLGQPAYRLTVFAKERAVPLGEALQFTGEVADASGNPVPDVQVGVEDPIARQSRTEGSMRTDAEGQFALSVPTLGVSPGVYGFVFLAPGAAEVVMAVGVLSPIPPLMAAPRLRVPLGNWGAVSDASIDECGPFALVHRYPEGTIPSASQSLLLQTADAIGEASVAFWQGPNVRFDGNRERDVCAIESAVPAAGGARERSEKELAPSELICSTKIGAKESIRGWLEGLVAECRAPPQEKENAKELLARPDAVIVAATVHPVEGLVPWPGQAPSWHVGEVRMVTGSQNPVLESGLVGEAGARGAPVPGLRPISISAACLDSPCALSFSVVPATTATTPGLGLLDVVFCIDCSGSMQDDIDAVKQNLDVAIGATADYCTGEGISLQMGLVTYTRHDDADNPAFGQKWLRAWPMTPEVEAVKQNIQAIEVLGMQAGAGGNEDMYASLLCGMNASDMLGQGSEAARIRATYGQPDGRGEVVDMGWRRGACKICIPIGDEPPSDPDWRERTLETVVERSENLDPVHMYPLLVGDAVSAWLGGARSAMDRLAGRTGGKTLRVNSAGQLPQALHETLQRAIAEYHYEIWKREHPPNLPLALILGGGGAGVVVVALIFGFCVVRLRAGGVKVQAWLEIHEAGGRVRQVPLRRNATRIGAARDNDVVLDDPNAAEHHAVVLASAQGLELEALSDEHETLVDGKRIDRARLHGGSRIRMGGAVLVLSARE